MEIPLHYNPRWYQQEGIQALESGVDLAVWCWARRGGKDLTAFSYASKKMVEQPMNAVLVFPTKEQGKTAFWENIENDGFKTIDHIPDQLVERRDNNNMRIILKNGSTFQLLGSTDPDALRGANGKLYIYSEFVDQPVEAFDVTTPIVAVNGGQRIVISTPKIDGLSGAEFKRMFEKALKDPSQFASRITAREYLSEEVLERLRQECIDKYGNDFFWRQEYLADWGQVSATSYYGDALQLTEKKGNIGEFAYNSAYPVYTAWDLGMSDSIAIVFFQYYNKTIYIIDYYETSNIGYSPIVEFIKSKPYNYGWHCFPHDGAVRDSDAITRIQKLRDLGLINSSLLQREAIDIGIERAVASTPNTKFNAATTNDLRRKLSLYKRKFNPITGDYLGPEHKTESHASDGYRYTHTAIQQLFNKETGEFLYSPANSQLSYQGEGITMHSLYQP